MIVMDGCTLGELATRLHGSGLLRVVPDAAFPATLRYTGVAFDFPSIRPGDLWVNLHGNSAEARDLLRGAGNAGAAATLAEFPDPGACVPHLRVTEPRLGLSLASSLLHGEPARRLAIAGITGTVGKSTTTCMAARCLDFAGIPHGISTSAAWRIGNEISQEEDLTTADAPELHRRLAAMLTAGAKAALLEVSSQGLIHQRVADVAFKGALVTNIGREHDEFHPDFNHYHNAKAMLFQCLDTDGFGLANADSPWCRVVSARCAAPVFRYGFADEADIRVDAGSGSLDFSTRFSDHFSIDPTAAPLRLALQVGGMHNLSNACGAAALALAMGVPAEAVGRAINSFPGLPGRGQFLMHTPVEIFHDVFERPALATAIPSLAATRPDAPCIVIIAPRANRTQSEYRSTTHAFLRLARHHRLRVKSVVVSRGRHSRTGEHSMPDAAWQSLLDAFKNAGLPAIPTDILASALDISMDRLRPGQRLLIFGERVPDNPMEMIRARLEFAKPRWLASACWAAPGTTDDHLRRALMNDPFPGAAPDSAGTRPPGLPTGGSWTSVSPLTRR